MLSGEEADRGATEVEAVVHLRHGIHLDRLVTMAIEIRACIWDIL